MSCISNHTHYHYSMLLGKISVELTVSCVSTDLKPHAIDGLAHPEHGQDPESCEQVLKNGTQPLQEAGLRGRGGYDSPFGGGTRRAVDQVENTPGYVHHTLAHILEPA